MASSADVLSFWERNPPFGAIAAAQLAKANIQCTEDPKGTKETIATLTLANGNTLEGIPMLIRYIIRSGTIDGLYGADAYSSCQVDYWLDYSANITPAAVESICVALNDYLAFRSFFVGFGITAADAAIWGALQGSPLWKKVRGSGKVPHLVRWFEFMSSLPEIKAALEALEGKKKAAAASAAASGKGGGNVGSFDVGLPNAQMGKVVTRFPPEPSGYLHIGHAKAALLNQHFAEMYKGQLIVRFDDTNPSKEKDEFVENILKDIADLGLRYKTLTYTSDYFPQMLELGEKLIKAGVLYADDTSVEKMREERMALVESKCRGRTVAESLKIFEEMKAGSEIGLANCIRFKFDMKDPNGCMRDPVAFRCNLTHHWRTGHKYKVYPTYDFACPFVDSLEGVTHALRTSEYKDREPQYYRILSEQQKVWPGLPNVNIWDYSRLNFINTVLSKRKLTWFVDTGKVDGWNDARMPTVQGVLRRGMQMEALKEFILQQGASKNTTVQEWDKIWTINKRLIDPVCPRHTAIELAGRVPVTLTNAPAEDEVVTVPKHKKNAAVGEKQLVRAGKVWLEQVDAAALQQDEEFTLMDWGNAIVKNITKDASGAVTAIEAELHLAGDVKKTKWKLTWLAQSAQLVNLTLVDFDHLVTKRKLEDEDNFLDFVNPNTKKETAAAGDPNMASLKKGDILQLERKGYYIVDEPAAGPAGTVVLFAIPDGRSKGLTKQ